MKRGSIQGSSVSSSDSDDDLSCNENWAPWNQSGKMVEMETILLASEGGRRMTKIVLENVVNVVVEV